MLKVTSILLSPLFTFICRACLGSQQVKVRHPAEPSAWPGAAAALLPCASLRPCLRYPQQPFQG